MRGGVVESAHRASVAVTGPDGAVLHAWGSVGDPVFPRSSNKPLQGVAMLRAGLTLPPHQLALACASHSAEPFHLDAVREMLTAAGLTEADLQNTPDLPYDPDERDTWIAAGHVARPLAQNCSGKHAAMLATCLVNGWDPTTYREVDHPLQRAMAATIARPRRRARRRHGRRRLRRPGHGHQPRRARPGVRPRRRGRARHPRGRRRRRHPRPPRVPRRHPPRRHRPHPRAPQGAIAKDGAEAVYAVGLADGRGIALKIADGAQRARPVVLAAVLRRLGVESTAYDRLEDAPVLGHGAPGRGARRRRLGGPVA